MLNFPDPPAGASANVIEAYTKGLPKTRYGLTAEDMRHIRRGLRRGELRNIEDPNGWGSTAARMCWGPVVTFTEEAQP